MIELFQMGGLFFMTILTIEFALILFFVAKQLLGHTSQIATVKGIGLLAIITGVLGQLIGLFSAFEAIQNMGSVSPALLAGGLKVSMITTIYGAMIYLVSVILGLLLNGKHSQ